MADYQYPSATTYPSETTYPGVWSTSPPTPPVCMASPGGSMLPGGTTVYLPRKRARKTGYKRGRR